MKALSIKQPWASLIAHGIKDVENRTWKTNFRGRIYIHSTKDVIYWKNALSLNQIDQVRIENYELLAGIVRRNLKVIPTSAIIGEVDIVDCVINHPSIWAENSIIKPKKDDFIYQFDVPNGIDSFDGDAYDIAMKKYQESKPIYNWILANPVLYEEPMLNVKGKLSFWNFEQK